MLRVLLYALPAEICNELRDALIAQHIVPRIEESEFAKSSCWNDFDVVFCPAQTLMLRSLLNLMALSVPERQEANEEAKQAIPRLIATSRLPSEEEWLGALEAGAADYCAAPFEPVQLRWLLHCNTPTRQINAA